jgi:lysophospholipase L1-like esterase
MKAIFLTIALTVVSVISYAQSTPKSLPAGRSGQFRTMDWGGFNRYAEANKQIATTPKVVFIGDSITDFWEEYRSSFFSDHNYLGRGIGAQTVEQMVVRFQQDVVDIHPRAVVILAGINDIAHNNGTIAFENIVGCIKTMCEVAKANGIIPIVCSLLPCHRFYWVPEATPAHDVIKLNEMLKAYTTKARIAYVDFHSQMGLPDGSLPEAYSKDGCHPTVEGYERMEEIIVPEIEKILKEADQTKARQSAPVDWGNFQRYEKANSELTKTPVMVLMGDSITDYWYDNDSAFFNRNNFLCRGIAGQTASQMLVRFNQDVIDLKPKAVAIMAGTNDLCQQLAKMSYYPDAAIIDNIIAMCELAEDAGIKVLLCSVTPCSHYMPIPDIDAGSRIVELNAKLKAYADSHRNVTYVDYFTPLANSEKGLDDDYSYDGIHPAVNLYDDMENILLDAFSKVVKVKRSDFYVLSSDEADRLKAISDTERKAKNMPLNYHEMVKMMSRLSSIKQ